MPTYVFKGRNRLNETVVGERVADNRNALRQILRKEQVTLTSVKEKGREIGIPKLGGRKKVKSKTLSIFTRQFSVMIDAGLPLVLERDGAADLGVLDAFQRVVDLGLVGAQAVGGVLEAGHGRLHRMPRQRRLHPLQIPGSAHPAPRVAQYGDGIQ